MLIKRTLFAIMIPCGDKTDEEIVRMALSKSEYFGCIISRYENKLRRYIKRVFPSHSELLDDLLQDIFIKTYIHLRDFDQDLKFSSWIYRIAHNESVSLLRKKVSHPASISLDDFEYDIFADETMFIFSESRLSKEILSNLLATIPDVYREVLVLKFIQGKDYKEISDILERPMGTVATLINRAKKKLKIEYELNKHKYE